MALLIDRTFRHLWRVYDVLSRRTLIEREITIFDDDIFITSYTRSGTTWMRFLLGNFVNPNEPVNFLNVERLVPDMYKNADWVLRRLPRPRLIKSHETFDARYPRVIYIVRDPRDVAISNYHWEMKMRSISEDLPIEEWVPVWMDGRSWPRVGSWADGVRSWLATRHGHDNFLLLRYEDIHENQPRELARVARFLGLNPDSERINQAIQRSSAVNLRKMEETQGKKWVATSRTRSDKPYIRQASSGGWQDVLPEQTVTYMERRWGSLMKQLRYELVSEPEREVSETKHRPHETRISSNCFSHQMGV
ncbi:MAG TPA: sulfotransferase domain-containing protein [Terriglobales bacterium]|nr:sulfotransferase domain-containing protein [Terriglobales bacterium]